MDYPSCIVSNQKEGPIIIQRVKSLKTLEMICVKVSGYDQEMPQSQTNHRHCEEETQKTKSHMIDIKKINKAIYHMPSHLGVI